MHTTRQGKPTINPDSTLSICNVHAITFNPSTLTVLLLLKHLYSHIFTITMVKIYIYKMD